MKVRMFFTRFAAAGVVTLTVAIGIACSGDNDPDQGSTPAGASTARGANPTATRGQDQAQFSAVIDQVAMAFVPERVSVRVGETILIKNSETVIHTANINGKNVTGNMKKGDSTPWTAQQPGEYKVTCEYHPQMKATITVTE